MRVVFWGAVAFIFYAYAGYPLLLLLVGTVRRRRVSRRPITPAVSFIITARNEEKRIGAKIENTLAQDYPPERFDVMVASDASDDSTDDIVRSYAHREVRLVRSPVRLGKEAAQRLAIERSSGEILVFSDVSTTLAPDGVRRIVENFGDSTVGCVSSVDRMVGLSDGTSGEGAYVRYEMFLRVLEMRTGTVVGLSGSFFAARREVCRHWAVDLPSDFHTVVNTVRMGLRAVIDSHSIGYYPDVADGTQEFQRKVRTVLRGICLLTRSVPLLNPLRYGLFAWQLFSHKLCRWLVPGAMLAALASNTLLALQSTGYLLILLGQALFYGLAVLGLWDKKWLKQRFLRLPSFFVLVNASIFYAWYRYVQGDRLVAWSPSQR